MNSSLEKLVKNLSEDYFKFLTQEFGSKNLELFKKRCLPLWIHEEFWKILWKKLLDKKCFYRFLKDGITDDNGKKLNGWSQNWKNI